MQVFRYQAESNETYRSFLQYLGKDPLSITQTDQIPFMPVEFFKGHDVKSGKWKEQCIYTSSGTTASTVSRHFVRDRKFYLDHSLRIFESFYGPVSGYHFLALLPGYLEREGSSLIDMVNHFIRVSGDPHSGFYLHDHDALRGKVAWLDTNSEKKILLLGVSFALMDLAEEGNFPYSGNLIVMETGGMKGRRREIIRDELHDILKSAFSVNSIHSEYGMTEALSQAYSQADGIFTLPFSMQIRLRDPNDPLDFSDSVQRGAVNLIDLANVHSCSFIQVSDLAERCADGRFRILGRLDNSDVRGCNLMIQQSFHE